MASITNHQVKQINLTLVPNSPVDINLIETDKIAGKLVDLFADSKITKTQLPEILFLLDPINQISVNVIESENRIIIGYNKPAQYTEVQLENFLRFCFECSKLINQNDIKAFGFNVASVFDIDGNNDSGKFLSDKFLKINAAFTPTVAAAGIKLIYKTESVRNQLQLEPRFDKDLEATKSVVVSFNAHRATALPAYSELLELCRKDYTEFGQNLTKIFAD
jgi:hypothetical protein